MKNRNYNFSLKLLKPVETFEILRIQVFLVRPKILHLFLKKRKKKNKCFHVADYLSTFEVTLGHCFGMKQMLSTF